MQALVGLGPIVPYNRESKGIHMSALGLATLRDLIEALPTGERRLVLLRYAEGFTDCEIAEVLGVDLEQVSTRLSALEGVLFEQMQNAIERELSGERAAAA